MSKKIKKTKESKVKINEIIAGPAILSDKQPTQGEVPVGMSGYKTPPLTNRPIIHTKESYAALIEVYKQKNPKKYELKKAALEAELRRLSR